MNLGTDNMKSCMDDPEFVRKLNGMDSVYCKRVDEMKSGLDGIVPIDFTAELCCERGFNGSHDWNLVSEDNHCIAYEEVDLPEGYFDKTIDFHNRVMDHMDELFEEYVVVPDREIVGEETEVSWAKRIGGTNES